MHVFMCRVSADLQNCFMNACMQMHNIHRQSEFENLCVCGGGGEREREHRHTSVHMKVHA